MQIHKNADRNVITEEVIKAGLRFDGKIWIEGLYSGSYRKPVFRNDAWYVRDHGWRKILSFQMIGKTHVRFSVRDFVIHASSRKIIHDGGDRPKWIDDSIHKVYAEIWKDRYYGLWSGIESYYVGARRSEDIPEQYRETEQCNAA